MTIENEKVAVIERISPYLKRMAETDIDRVIDTGDILEDANFHPNVEHPFGRFYAPFDWVNEQADIVLIGITPGKRQAKTALKTLRHALASGRTAVEAAELAKQAASFEGDMRDIATQLMDRFELHRVFGLRTCGELFEGARHRAHYTSLLRYPVLHWKTVTRRRKGAKIKTTGWFDYSGSDHLFKNKLLSQSRETDFEREIIQFRNAWLVPFGVWPASALDRLVEQGVLSQDRILSGINHPSGGQWNRHYCQLNRSEDHSTCGPKVGCLDLRKKSEALDNKVAEILATLGG